MVVNLTKWGKRVRVASDEMNFASSWLCGLHLVINGGAYEIIVEIHTQQNSPHRLTV